MEMHDFLAAVLPSSGHYCTFEMPSKRHQFFADIDALDSATQAVSEAQRDAYFALASFEKRGTRVADNAVCVRSLFIDLDVGSGPKVYPTKRDAVLALADFSTKTGLDALGSPWLVDSGGGVHAYWPLDNDATIAEWLPVAEGFKRKAKELNFKIDMTVTADAARILRPPGTMNHKYDPPRPVVLKHRGGIFSLAAMAALVGTLALPAVAGTRPTALGTLPGHKPTAVAGAPVMTALTQNHTTLFKNILVRSINGTGCGQVKHYVENASQDGLEPMWRGMLSLAMKCDDAQKACARISALHPYTPERMHLKLSEIKGPYPCTKLDSENPGICGECPHWGKITNPLVLGRELAVDTEEKAYEVPPNNTIHPGAHLQRPQPPRGFMYANGGGVYQRQDLPDGTYKDVLLLPFDFFMVDMLQEGTTYMSRFAAVRAKNVVYVTVPNKSIGSKDEIVKALASQNIIAAHGTGNDKNLFDYVRSCVGAASAADSSLRVPPNMGWQPDGGFAVSDQVMLPHGQTYQYVSDRLTNLINVTSTKGTLGDWQRVMQMLQDKELWGILAFGAIGFGSPLMQWVDDGTPGMTFHVCGKESGVGKTLGLALCSSVWGSPTQYPVKPSTSERTMLQRAGLLGSLPLVIDELTSKSHISMGEWMPNFVFDYSQGGHKLKGSGSANAELVNDMTWKGLAVLSSNVPELEKMMGARDVTSEGEARRMLELHLHDPIQWTEAEREIKELLKSNYGVAGRIYAQWLADNTDTAKDVLVAVMEKWRKKHVAQDAERFWTSGCCACIAGMILCGPKYANIFTFNSQAIAAVYAQMLNTARKIINSNQQSAEDILNAYTREFHGQFVKLGPAQNGMPIFGDGRQISKDSAKGRIAGRVEYDITPGWVDYYIEVNMLKRYCATRNWSYLELQRQLSDTMIAVETRKDILARTNGPSMRVLCLKVSRMIDEGETV